MKKTIKFFALMVLIILSSSIFAACGGGIKETATNEMIELDTWFFTSGLRNNAIKVKHSNEDAVFECTVDNGELWVYDLQQYVKKATVKAGDTFHWSFEIDENGIRIENAYIQIIVKIDEQIVGYAVIGINMVSETNYIGYDANVLKSSLFPKVNGQYQDITEEYVKSLIEKIKTMNEEELQK